MKIIMNTFIICALLSCASSPKTCKNSILESIIESKKLLVGTTFDYPPFSYKDKDGMAQGSDIEAAKDLAHSLSVELILVETSWRNLLADLKDKKFHAVMSGVSKNLTRQKVAFFSDSYMDNGKLPISLCKNKMKFQSLKMIDKETTRLIVNPGGTNFTYVQKNMHMAQVTLHEDNTTIFNKIIDDTADLMITDSAEVYYQVKKHRGLLCATTTTPLTAGKLAYLLPPDIVWKEYVNTWLELRTKSALRP